VLFAGSARLGLDGPMLRRLYRGVTERAPRCPAELEGGPLPSVFLGPGGRRAPLSWPRGLRLGVAGGAASGRHGWKARRLGRVRARTPPLKPGRQCTDIKEAQNEGRQT
jgi:hypothetical protein